MLRSLAFSAPQPFRAVPDLSSVSASSDDIEQFFRCPDGGAAVPLKELWPKNLPLEGDCDLEPPQPCYAKNVSPDRFLSPSGY